MNFEQNFLGKTSPSKVYAITSGKGGVGKTFIAINLSITFAKVGMRVLLIDADLGLANVDILTGIRVPHTIEEVINEEASIFDVLVEGPENVTILPAASGLGSIGEMNEKGLQFKKELLKLENAFDFIFIDTGAGISANVVDFVFMAEEVIVVMTPEPTAFADAYAMVKLVSMEKPEMKVGIIINLVKNQKEAERVFTKFNEIVKRFLDRDVRYRGGILRDKAVGEAVMRQVPLSLYAGKSPSMQSIREVAGNFLGLKTAKKISLFSR
ncbi:MinD/ParA family protein [Candidatus Latescibacterota bacterium]